jgi:hypothetical protein
LTYFEHHFRKKLEAEGIEFPDNDVIKLVVRDIELKYIPTRVIPVQKCYLRQLLNVYMGLSSFVQKFVAAQSLHDLNRYLLKL